MCGIAGYRGANRPGVDVLSSMLGRMVHRGPDAEGVHVSGDYVAGMRRLSIMDLETGGQPLFSADRNVVLLYNGEIYNYVELRRWLEGQGVRLVTGSDGEVICHLYEFYGEELFELLDGMFAAALWVEDEQKLILARDIPGEKPLYYARLANGALAFSSEIKSLKQFPGIDLGLNLQAIWDFPTYLWVPEPSTVFAGISALPKGTMLISEPGGIRLKQIENRFNGEPLGHADADVVAETRRVVDEAILSRLQSDVPVGCNLSGGLDSSIIACVAARELSELTTFTIGFENVADPYHGHANEAPQAQWLANRLGTTHHTLRVNSESFRSRLAEFAYYGDQPFSVSSALGVYMIAQKARECGIKVLLSGDGADECFGGYSWYEWLNSIPQQGGESSAVSFQSTGTSVEERLRAMVPMSPEQRAWAWHYYASEKDKTNLYHRDVASEVKSSLMWIDRPENACPQEPLDYIRHDRNFYFPFEMLRKLDRMCMGNSVEGRAPFAAPAVLSHADKLRYGHMVRDGCLKWALRRAYEDVVPREVVTRPKHGFNVPIDLWLKGEWADLVDEAFAQDSALTRHGLINGRSGENARRMLSDTTTLHGHTVFSFIMLNIWLEGL